MDTLRALSAALACYSHKGHSFDVPGVYSVPTPLFRKRAKRITVRAERRVSRALERTAVEEMAAEEWAEYLEMEALHRQQEQEEFLAYMEDDRLEKEFWSIHDELYEDDPEYADDWADRHHDLYFGSDHRWIEVR